MLLTRRCGKLYTSTPTGLKPPMMTWPTGPVMHSVLTGSLVAGVAPLGQRLASAPPETSVKGTLPVSVSATSCSSGRFKRKLPKRLLKSDASRSSSKRRRVRP